MRCISPLKGYWSKDRHPVTRSRIFVVSSREGFHDRFVDIPCQKCMECRLERSRQWAVRCMHEAATHDHNSFITLTYRPEDLPKAGTLVLKHWQKFMMDLRALVQVRSDRNESDERKARRAKVLTNPGKGIRYFHCGEYGEKGDRPHYHAIMFNCDFGDKDHRTERGGFSYYRSPILAELWGRGNVLVTDVSFETAAYVARYCTKKISGDAGWYDKKGVYHFGASEHYGVRRPEYATMSRRPGLGREWFDLFHEDWFERDFLVIREKKMKIPQAYNRWFEAKYPERMKRIKAARRRLGKLLSLRKPQHTLGMKLEISQLRFKQLKRGYENAA